MSPSAPGLGLPITRPNNHLMALVENFRLNVMAGCDDAIVDFNRAIDNYNNVMQLGNSLPTSAGDLPTLRGSWRGGTKAGNCLGKWKRRR